MDDVRVVVGGTAAGPVVVLDEPLSFWGGFSAERGLVIDDHHPQSGVSLSGAIVVMVGARGSSSASSVLAESVRLGTAPAALPHGHVQLPRRPEGQHRGTGGASRRKKVRCVSVNRHQTQI